jgi:TetR/AcrR family transcriptional regulator, repressor for uid operon
LQLRDLVVREDERYNLTTVFHRSFESQVMPHDGESRDRAAIRIVAAAREEFERYGIRRTTVEQVARRAGVSRVTVYRKFDGKEALVRAVVLDDIQRFARHVDSLWRSDDAVEDRLIETCTLAVMALRRNPLFNTLLRSEPDALLQQLTLDGEEIFKLACDVLAARLQEHVEKGDLPELDVRLASELVVRLGFSVVVLPFGGFPGQDEDDVRRQLRSAVIPILHGQAPAR